MLSHAEASFCIDFLHSPSDVLLVLVQRDGVGLAIYTVIFLTLFLHFSSCSPSFQYSGIDGPLLVEDLTRNEPY